MTEITNPADIALAEIIAELFAASEVEFEPGEGTDVRIDGEWLEFSLHKTGTIVGRVLRSEVARRTVEVSRRRETLTPGVN